MVPRKNMGYLLIQQIRDINIARKRKANSQKQIEIEESKTAASMDTCNMDTTKCYTMCSNQTSTQTDMANCLRACFNVGALTTCISGADIT